MLTFGSLFAGIGGFDLGFERAGMVCKWQVEIDDYANRVLAKHWPNVRRLPDVRTWPQPDTERVDVICGGFPCQDISYAGRGAGLEGKRSGLFFEAVRVVRQLRPRIVCLENVAALLTRGLDVVLGTLAEIGYDAEWHCIPAAAVGAPHIRDRAWVVAYAASECSRKSHTAGQTFRLDASNSQDRSVICNVTCVDGQGVAHTNGMLPQRLWSSGKQIMDSRSGERESEIFSDGRKQQWSTLARFCRMVDGISTISHGDN